MAAMCLGIITILFLCIALGIVIKNRKPKEKLQFIDLNTFNSGLFRDLATDSIRNGALVKASYYFSKAIEFTPDVSDNYAARGKVYWEIDLRSLAVIDWKKVQALGALLADDLMQKNRAFEIEQTDVDKCVGQAVRRLRHKVSVSL